MHILKQKNFIIVKILLTRFNCSNQHINTFNNNYYSKNKLYYRKKSIGGCNFVFNISFINFRAADWAVINKMQKLKYPILCLNKSVINHIGKKELFLRLKNIIKIVIFNLFIIIYIFINSF